MIKPKPQAEPERYAGPESLERKLAELADYLANNPGQRLQLDSERAALVDANGEPVRYYSARYGCEIPCRAGWYAPHAETLFYVVRNFLDRE